MSKIRLTPAAAKLAKKTGLDQLSDKKLAKLDANDDAKVTLRDLQRVVRDAGINADGKLTSAELKKVNRVLGGDPRIVGPHTRVGGGEASDGSRQSALNVRLNNQASRVRGGESSVGGSFAGYDKPFVGEGEWSKVAEATPDIAFEPHPAETLRLVRPGILDFVREARKL